MPKAIPFARRSIVVAITTLGCSLGATTLAPQLHAQQLAIEEVVVTARKRDESMQDVPIAITAFSGDQLRDAGVTNIKTLGLQVPGLQIDEASTAQIWIRGIGQRDDGARVDGPVGVYLDGLYIPRKDGQLLDIMDVQSVQVLRGPQGTLFGKNTTGGALIITTKAPTEEFGGDVQARFGNYDRQDFKATLNVPLIKNTLLSKLTLASIERDGYMDNIVTGQTAASEDRQSAALQLHWTPSDTVSVDTFAYYGETREVQPATNCRWMENSSFNGEDSLFGNRVWPGDTVGVDAFDDNDTPLSPGLTEQSTVYEAACHESQALTKKRKYVHETPHAAFNLDNTLLGVTINWDISDDLALKSITGYGDQKKFGNGGNPDNDATRLPISTRYHISPSNRDQWSQEFQLNGSAFAEKLDYTFGLFGMEEDIDDGTDAMASYSSGSLIPPNILVINSPSGEKQTYELKNSTYAAFFQGSYQLTENIEFTAGVRWTSEEREQTVQLELLDEAEFRRIAFDAIAGVPGILVPLPSYGVAFVDPNMVFAQDIFSIITNQFSIDPSTGLIDYALLPAVENRASETWEETTPMVSLSYRFPESMIADSIVDSAMVYVSYAEGFKSGTFEPVGLDGQQTVEPETVANIEFGFKLDLFASRMRMNGAVFSTDFDDMQLRQVQMDSTNTPRVVLTNASKTRIQGIELELTLAPVDNLLLIATGSYNDYEYLDFEEQQFSSVALLTQQPLPVVDRSGEPFAEVPDMTYSLAVQYTLETDYGRFVPRMDYSYIDDIFMGLDAGAGQNVNQSSFDDYGLLSARLGWTSPDEKYQITVYGTNLTDEFYYFGAAAVGDSVGTFPVTAGPPRMYGVELGYNF
ncbi:MAG: TonB-dependent receptor [Pseudomonadales bacterium]